MSDCSITREWEDDRLVVRISGTFDRPAAWTLRDRLEREQAPEAVLDFSLVREFSDLAVAVLAHGIQTTPRRFLFRGLRQHQLRIFRYCGVAAEDAPPRETLPPAAARPAGAPAEKRA